jgi:hypothetical protein
MELSNTEIKIVVKNMAREMIKKTTAKNAELRLTREQYDRMIDNKTAVDAYKTCKHSWSISGVTISGSDDAIATVKAAARNATAKNADEPKFDGEGFLLDKNGKPFFVYNDTTAGLIIRKYKEMGINLKAEKDRIGNVYFKKAQ